MEFNLPQPWRAALEIVRMDFPDAVIAGGCLRDLILGREPKDIDIFACHPDLPISDAAPTAISIRHWGDRYLGPSRCVINDAWAEYNEAMDGVVCAVEIDAGITRPLPIQLITMNRPVTLQSAVERIDFGLCRVSHDGETLFRHPDFDFDVENKQFTLRRSGTKEQYDRSVVRHRRLMAKYPWPMVFDNSDQIDWNRVFSFS